MNNRNGKGWRNDPIKHGLASKGIATSLPIEVTDSDNLSRIVMNRGKTHPYRIEISDPSDFDHELGHIVLRSMLRGDLERPERVLTEGEMKEFYHEDLGEAYANSFSDYINYPNKLEEDCPQLYKFWDEVFEKNPSLEDDVVEMQKRANKENLYEKPEYIWKFMDSGDVVYE